MIYTILTVSFLAVFSDFVQAQAVENLGFNTIYFCPPSQSIENYYAGTCLESARNGGLVNTGSWASTDYAGAPGSYKTSSLGFSLSCEYRVPGSEDTVLFCSYEGGDGVRPTLASDQDEECPPFTAEAQPSKRAVVEKRSLEKRYDRSPPRQCPRAAADPERYMVNAQTFTGANAGGTFTYFCKVRTSEGMINCPYEANGYIRYDREEYYDCPFELCYVPESSNFKRSARRGVYKEGQDRIQARQVNTTVLRQRGKRSLEI